MFVTLLTLVLLADTGCTKDTDCKGDRVCEAGICVSPVPMAPAPFPEPPPSTEGDPALEYSPPPTPPGDVAPMQAPPATAYPQLVRLPGQVCIDRLNTQGLVMRGDCAIDTPKNVRALEKRVRRERDAMFETRRREAKRAQRDAQGPREPSLAPVGDIAGHGGVLITGSGVLGAFGLTGSGGVVFRPGIGIVGVAFANFAPSSFGVAQFYGLGPAARFGRKSHVAVGVAPVLGIIPATTVTPTTVGVTTALFVRGALVIGDHFMLTAQPTLYADNSGLFFTITAGAGFSF